MISFCDNDEWSNGWSDTVAHARPTVSSDVVFAFCLRKVMYLNACVPDEARRIFWGKRSRIGACRERKNEHLQCARTSYPRLGGASTGCGDIRCIAPTSRRGPRVERKRWGGRPHSTASMAHVHQLATPVMGGVHPITQPRRAAFHKTPCAEKFPWMVCPLTGADHHA